MRTILNSFILILGLSTQSLADVYQDLYDAMYLDDIAEIMQDEGGDYVDSIGISYLEGRSLDRYKEQGHKLYDLAGLQTGLLNGLREELDADVAAQVLEFYETEAGQIAAKLEVSARRAISDQAVEDMAEAMVQEARSTQPERIADLLKFIQDLDLVQKNLEGSFNSQFAFLSEISTVRQFGLDEQTILGLLAEGQSETERNIKQWLMAFTFMAYQPLTDKQFNAYLGMQRSDIGQDLNTALFTVFHDIDTQISRDLGKIVARLLTSQDL